MIKYLIDVLNNKLIAFLYFNYNKVKTKLFKIKSIKFNEKYTLILFILKFELTTMIQ